MKHQGQELEARIKAKGFSVKGIADAIGISRVAVEKHLKMAIVTRKVLSRYAEPLGLTADGFYAECDGQIESTVETADTQSATYWKEKYYRALEEYNDLLKSVFTKAAPSQHLLV